MPDAAMERLLPLIKIREHKQDDIICAEGDPGREMFVLRTGKVEVRKHAREGTRIIKLAQMGVGDCFGEMSLIDIQPRSATVLALEDTSLYVVSNMDLYKLYEADLPSYACLVQNICRELSRRLRRSDAIIADFFLRLESYVGLVLD
jgi:CRP-like cAMP-binding protein